MTHMVQTMRVGSTGENVLTLKRLLRYNGYGYLGGTDQFDFETKAAVEVFQAQHVGADGEPLQVDGVVGSSTIWALTNPSGDAQRSWRAPQEYVGLTDTRSRMLHRLDAEHAKNVFEDPDGSNRSPRINTYFNGTGMIGLAWCCVYAMDLSEPYNTHNKPPRKFLAVYDVYDWAKSRGLLVAQPKPGDWFLQLFSARKGHIGFCTGVSEDGASIYTNEGNCGNRLKQGKRQVNSVTVFVDFLQDGQTLDFKRGTDNFLENIGGSTR